MTICYCKLTPGAALAIRPIAADSTGAIISDATNGRRGPLVLTLRDAISYILLRGGARTEGG